MSKVLIVDDDKNFASALSTVVQRQGYQVDVVNDCKNANSKLSENGHDIVLVDMVLPDGSGIDVIENAPVGHNGRFVVITGHPSVDTAVRTMRGRAIDYLVKPVDAGTVVELLSRLQSLEQAAAAAGDKSAARSENSHGYGQQLLGKSPAIMQLKDQTAKIAPTAARVLIQGESGSGKELVAERIHRLSKRPGELHAINCGAISRDLIGSELFGHEKGSFTGANAQRQGIFERADGGTLFLDEITEMPIDMQVHLLRVIETGKINRVGSNKEIAVDVRILSATNCDPMKAVQDGKLREDLYFRLAEMPLAVPSLRERGHDIELLANYFISVLNREYQGNKSIDEQAMLLLMRYSWPGNVRELHHVIHRAYIVSESVLDLSQLRMSPQNDSQSASRMTVGQTIAEIEERLIQQTLEHFEGDKPKSARVLGISLKTLYNRLNRYDRPRHPKSAQLQTHA